MMHVVSEEPDSPAQKYYERQLELYKIQTLGR